MLSSTKDISLELKHLRSRIKFVSENNNSLLKRFKQSSDTFNLKNNEDNAVKGSEENGTSGFLKEKEVSIVKNCFEKSVRRLKDAKEKKKHIYKLSQSVQKSKKVSCLRHSNFHHITNVQQEHKHVPKRKKTKASQISKENETCTSIRSYVDSGYNNISNFQSNPTKIENKVLKKEHLNEVEVIAILNRKKISNSSYKTESIVSKNKSSNKKLAAFSIDSLNIMEENKSLQNRDICHIQNGPDCFILPSSLSERNTKVEHNSEIQQCCSTYTSIEHKEEQHGVDSVVPMIELTDPEVVFVTAHKTKVKKFSDKSYDSWKIRTKKSQKSNSNFNNEEPNIHNRNLGTDQDSNEKCHEDSELCDIVHIDKVNTTLRNIDAIAKENNSIKENSVNCTISDEVSWVDMSIKDSYLNESSGSFETSVPVWDFTEEPVDFPVPKLHLFESLRSLSERDLKLLNSKGIKINEGRWSKEEVDLLKRNLRNFTSQFGINNVDLLLGIGHRFSSVKCENKNVRKFIKAKHFYVRLGKDINHRTLIRIYLKARKLLNPWKSNVGSPTADWPLIQQLQKKYGNKWELIGYKLRKSPAYCAYVYYNLNNHSRKGRWSNAEVEKLIYGIQTVTKSVNLSHENLRAKISWTKVCKFVPNRSAYQCQCKWFSMNKK